MKTKNTNRYEIFGLEPFPLVERNTNLFDLICATQRKSSNIILSGDVLVIASKVISLVENRIIDLRLIKITERAKALSKRTGKDPRMIQLILDDAQKIIFDRGPIVTLNSLGMQLTSGGIDRHDEDHVVLLPKNPDQSASNIRRELSRRLDCRDISVIIADSDGRPDRGGSTVIAVGSSGFNPLRRTKDPTQNKIQEETIVDMLAGAAGIVLGQRGRGAPVVVIRGVKFDLDPEAGLSNILHNSSKGDLKCL